MKGKDLNKARPGVPDLPWMAHHVLRRPLGLRTAPEGVLICTRKQKTAPRRGVVQILKNRGFRRILDVCCGAGSLSSRLASAGFEVIGVDSSPTMLNRARRKRRAVELLLLDATEMFFEHEFDAAIISLALHEMTPDVRERVWQKMHGATRSGGLLIALDFTLSKRTSMRSRLFSSFIERGERNFLKSNPAHYANYREFMQSGGLCEWVRHRKGEIEEERYYWSGNVVVIAVAV